MYIIILDYSNKEKPVSIHKMSHYQEFAYRKLCESEDGTDYAERTFKFDSSNCHWIIIEDEKLNLILHGVENIQFLNKNLQSITIW